MLFADAPGELEKWVGPVLTTAGATVAALFAWLSGRDKYRFDAGVVKMQAKIENLVAENQERKNENEARKAETLACHEERDRDRDRHEEDRKAHKAEIDQLWTMIGDRRHSDDGPPPGVPEQRSPRTNPRS